MELRQRRGSQMGRRARSPRRRLPNNTRFANIFLRVSTRLKTMRYFLHGRLVFVFAIHWRV